MHSWARWTFIVVVLVMVASAAGPARADFGNCATEEFAARTDARLRAEGVRPEAIVRRREAAYLEQFDERIGAVEYDCVERLRVPVATRSGTRHVRIIHDRSADWIADASSMAAFERGARSAVEAIGRLGGVDLENVTLLLADDFPPRADAHTFSDIAALAEFDNDGECRVVFYLAGPVSLAEHAAWVTAHEVFHCVQAANLAPAQISSGSNGLGGGGDWWIEGSASWFAALSVPDLETMRGFLDGFDAASPATPLNRMAYEASVFFLWLGQDRSPPQVMLFLAGMAPSRAESAQRTAMLDALPQESWLKFAEDYLDDRIRHPHGGDLGLNPGEGEVWTWSATRTQSQPIEPFTLVRSKLVFECGRWRTSVRPAPAHHARDIGGADWAPLPAEIDASEGREANYRFVAMHAGPSRATLNIVGTQESGCGDCAGVRETDACLIGSWQLTGGGSVEWMRRQGIPGDYSTRNETITFRRDGTFVTAMLGMESQVEMRHGRADGRAQAQAGGRWSTRDGVLNLCSDMQHLSGRTVFTSRDGRRVTVPVPAAPPSDTRQRYSCAGASLSMEIDIPGAPPMPSQYTRTGGEEGR
ncbi:MAG: hypothetical protein ACREH4_07195 [Vitreimonas sp.]